MHVRTSACMYVCIHVRLHVRTYACTYVCKYVEQAGAGARWGLAGSWRTWGELALDVWEGLEGRMWVAWREGMGLWHVICGRGSG